MVRLNGGGVMMMACLLSSSSTLLSVQLAGFVLTVIVFGDKSRGMCALEWIKVDLPSVVRVPMHQERDGSIECESVR